MIVITSIFVAVFGLLVGSFISAYSYRMPRNIGISTGRSKCTKCKKLIAWYDNIPVVSYIFLKGMSRCCKRRISLRYPLIELSTAVVFTVLFHQAVVCAGKLTAFCMDVNTLGLLSLPIVFVIFGILIMLFVIDLEHQILPDGLIFTLLALASMISVIRSESIYADLVAGFAASLFLLALNFLTKGRGMGLGDVKLVIPLGMLIGLGNTMYWMTTSFVIGAVVGVALILVGKAHFGKHIPFGPFLIFAFGLLYIFGFPDILPLA